MKFRFERDLMIKEIAIAQEIISTKNVGSVLSNVLLIAENDQLVIKATDIKVNFQTSIPIEIEEEGTTTIYCDKFMSILNSLNNYGLIEFNLIDNEATIKPVDKKINFKLKCISEEKFPDFIESENISYFEISSKDIKSMISQTSFAVSDDETRFFMNGVYFEKKDSNLNLVATDGRRLSFATKNILSGINDFPSAIVHPKILNIISKYGPEEGNILMSIIDKMIFFKFGNYKFGSVLIEGNYPDYTRVIPKAQENSLIVKKNDLLQALKRVSLMVDKKAGKISFNIDNDTIKIASSEYELGSAKEEIPCKINGANINLNLNIRYIEEPLKVINSEDIEIKYTSELKAITVKAISENECFHVVMPMQ